MNISPNRTGSTFQAFKQGVRSLWERGWEKYNEFTRTPYFHAIDPLGNAINKITYLGNYVFEKMRSTHTHTQHPTSSDVEKAHPFIAFIYDLIALQPIPYTMNFIMLHTLFFDSRNNINDRKKAKLSGDQYKILDANLGAVTLTGRYFSTLNTIKNFISVFRVPISNCFKFAASVGGAVSLFFSTAGLFQAGFRLRSTAKLVESLKQTRHLAFMNAYISAQTLDSKAYTLDKLSPKELRNRVKAVKKELRNTGEHTLLENIVKVSNQAFTQAVAQKVDSDSDFVGTHFHVGFKKVDSPTQEDPNFFKKLSLPKVQNNAKNLTEAVSLIKQRLRQKKGSDIYSIITSIINFAPSLIFTVAGLMSINPVFFPVAAGITLVLAVASLINIFVTDKLKRDFMRDMERVVA